MNLLDKQRVCFMRWDEEDRLWRAERAERVLRWREEDRERDQRWGQEDRVLQEEHRQLMQQLGRRHRVTVIAVVLGMMLAYLAANVAIAFAIRAWF